MYMYKLCMFGGIVCVWMCICVCTVHVCGGIVHARMYAGVFVFMSVCVQYACLCIGSVHV